MRKKPLFRLWRYRFEEEILYRGFSYFQSGDVIGMDCTCPYAKRGRYCKHMAALLFAVTDPEEPVTIDSIGSFSWISDGYDDRDGVIDWRHGDDYAEEFVKELNAVIEPLLKQRVYQEAFQVIQHCRAYLWVALMSVRIGNLLCATAR